MTVLSGNAQNFGYLKAKSASSSFQHATASSGPAELECLSLRREYAT